MIPAYMAQIGFIIRSTNVRALKINSSLLKIYEIVSARFLVQDKESRERFFDKTFLLADTSIEIVLDIPFLSFNKTDIDFELKALIQRKYSATKAFPIISQIQLIDKYKFARVILNENLVTFVMHVIVLEAIKMTIYLFQTTQVVLPQLATLQ